MSVHVAYRIAGHESNVDPSTYALVVGVLVIVATLVAYIPARRAARIEPLLALRQD